MGIRLRRCAVRRGVAAALLATVALVEQPAVGHATPLPPPNPGDDEVEVAREHADSAVGLVGRLANQAAEADAALLALQSEVELKREETNKALINLKDARAAVAAAQAEATRSRAQADSATAQIRVAQRLLDQFAAASFRQGSAIGSVSAFLGSRNPQDLLARAELLDAVGGGQLDAVANMRRTQIVAANKDARAREALAHAHSAEQAATSAKTASDAAYQAAIAAEAAQAGQTAVLWARRTDLERKLAEAQQAVAGLADQRQRYARWVAGRDHPQVAPAPESIPRNGAQTVINRALTQRGMRYSWGGGDANGATIGIRDGGIADGYGDYRAVGFDCSGLMVYAFAQALGYSLPHYSGLQYDAGRKVPLALKRPGDMLFWGTSGRIHHVALYLGDEQMIEAPYSGAVVRITSVRYSGIMPYAIRML